MARPATAVAWAIIKPPAGTPAPLGVASLTHTAAPQAQAAPQPRLRVLAVATPAVGRVAATGRAVPFLTTTELCLTARAVAAVGAGTIATLAITGKAVMATAACPKRRAPETAGIAIPGAGTRVEPLGVRAAGITATPTARRETSSPSATATTAGIESSNRASLIVRDDEATTTGPGLDEPGTPDGQQKSLVVEVESARRCAA